MRAPEKALRLSAPLVGASSSRKGFSRSQTTPRNTSEPSTCAACVATMICFAFIDPVLVGNDDYPPPAFASRMSGYAIGFFFFWLISALSSLLTLYLARTARPDQ